MKCSKGGKPCFELRSSLEDIQSQISCVPIDLITGLGSIEALVADERTSPRVYAKNGQDVRNVIQEYCFHR